MLQKIEIKIIFKNVNISLYIKNGNKEFKTVLQKYT